MVTWAVNCGSAANSLGLLVGCLCFECRSTTFINHVSTFIVYDSKPHPHGTSQNQHSVLSLSSALVIRQRLVMDGSTARRPPVPFGLAPNNLSTLASPEWLTAKSRLTLCPSGMLGGDSGDSSGGGGREGFHSKLKTMPYIHDDTLPRATGRATATNHTSWSDSLRHGDASCLWSHIHRGLLFLPVLHTYKHTHMCGRPVRRSRKLSWWMCACSWGCLRCMAADRCWRNLQKTLLTNRVSAIHQARLPAFFFSTALPRLPSHPQLHPQMSAPCKLESCAKARSFTPACQTKLLLNLPAKSGSLGKSYIRN